MKKITFFILCLEGAVLSFNFAAASALIPSIAKEFAVVPVVVGKITWLYMLPYGLAALFYGPLARVFKVKKIEMVCLFFFSLSNLWASMAVNIHQLFIARFFMGAFGASVTPLVLILIGNSSNTSNRGKLIGGFFSVSFFASLVGFFLSGMLYWRLIFLLPAIFGFALCFFIYFYLPKFSHLKSGLKINYIAALKNKSIQGLFIYILFVSMFYHGVQQWLSVYFSENFKLEQFLISMLITVTSLSGIFGEVVGGWLSDAWGRFKTVEAGIILLIISALLLILKSPFIILAILMFVWGLGWTFNHVGLSTMLTEVPKEFLNEVSSLNSSVRFLAGGIGVSLGGFFIAKSFYLHFCIFGLSLIILAFLARRMLCQN